MAEWLYEAGIGENRAALVEDDRIVEARIEREHALRAGDGLTMKLVEKTPDGRRGVMQRTIGFGLATDVDLQAIIDPLTASLTIGHPVQVVVVREAIPDAAGRKRIKVRPAATFEGIHGQIKGPTLLERIGETPFPVRELRLTQPDELEAAGWTETLEEAEAGRMTFDGGSLHIALTPAMTLIDVDGWLPPDQLAVAGARAAARAIRLYDLGGSIGVDLPTTSNRDVRKAASAAFDDALPKPFERTAINGFGFLQIVRPRPRASLIERLRDEPIDVAARNLLRRAGRAGIGAMTLVVSAALYEYFEAGVPTDPVLIERFGRQHGWLLRLGAAVGGAISLRRDASLADTAGYAVAT